MLPIWLKVCSNWNVLPQLGYADMLNRVDPLRRELKELEGQAETSRIKAKEINKIINELEESISRYKEEYAVLISEANAIKSDLATVEAKVGASIKFKIFPQAEGDRFPNPLHIVHITYHEWYSRRFKVQIPSFTPRMQK